MNPNNLITPKLTARVAIASTLVGLVAFFELAILSLFPGFIPMSLFVGPAILASWIGGRRTGVWAMLLGAMVEILVLNPHLGSRGIIGSIEPGRLIFYLGSTFTLIQIGHYLRSWYVKSINEEKSRLIKARDRARQANWSKTNFVASISHDLRTPLGAIIGYLDLLASPSTEPSQRQRYIEVARQNGQLLQELVDDLLDLAKIESDTFTIEKSFVNATSMIRDWESVMGIRARHKGIDLLVQGANLPDEIEIDATRVKQVLFNLMSNAIKFTNRGHVIIEFEFESIHNGQSLMKIDVVDTGCGITPEQASRVFVPYEQGSPNTQRIFGGWGLGLPLAKKLAQRMGGDVTLVSSRVGHGSRFRFTLPVSTRSLSPDSQARESLFESEQKCKGLEILVIDDIEENRYLLHRVLATAGARATLVASGKAAIELLNQKKFDVVLLDIQMPEMDGFETMAQLLARGLRTPVIALTAYAREEDRDACLTAGFSAHISKPINRRDLIQAIAQLAERGKLEHQSERPLWSASDAMTASKIRLIESDGKL